MKKLFLVALLMVGSYWAGRHQMLGPAIDSIKASVLPIMSGRFEQQKTLLEKRKTELEAKIAELTREFMEQKDQGMEKIESIAGSLRDTKRALQEVQSSLADLNEKIGGEGGE